MKAVRHKPPGINDFIPECLRTSAFIESGAAQAALYYCFDEDSKLN
jgi:hypothetical protein